MKTYTPKSVSELLGIAPGTQREMRLRLGSFFFGQQLDNGRWVYSTKDMIGMGCVVELQKKGLSQSDAILLVKWIVSDVASHLGLKSMDALLNVPPRNQVQLVYPDSDAYEPGRLYKYALFTVGGSHPVITDDLKHVSNFNHTSLIVVRLDKLAEALPEKLVARLRVDEMDDGGEDG